MGATLYKPRTGCALHGALKTLAEIRGVVPIVHSNPGCAIQSYLSSLAGGSSAGRIHGLSVPGTDVQERHIIFGGASRLREQIKNTVKVVNGDLYVVLNSCEASMVGDDLDSMVQEDVDQGYPVVDCLAAGFQGDAHFGYETVLTNLFQKVPALFNKNLSGEQENQDVDHDAEVRTRRPVVNVLGLIPGEDPYFAGDLEAITEILEAVGIEVHRFFRTERGVEELAHADEADLTLIFSKWGVRPAAYLKQSAGVPYAYFDSLPSGYAETEEFVQKLEELLPLDHARAAAYLEKEQAFEKRFLEDIGELFVQAHLNRTAAIAGEQNQVIQIGKALHRYLDVRIETAVITDRYPEPEDLPVREEEQLEKCADSVVFSNDTEEITSLLRQSGADIWLGSALEKETAREAGKGFLEISRPVSGQGILNKTYAGPRGNLRLLESFITAVLEADERRDEELAERFGL